MPDGSFPFESLLLSVLALPAPVLSSTDVQPGPIFACIFPFQADYKYLLIPSLPSPTSGVLMNKVLWMQLSCLPPNNSKTNLVGSRKGHLSSPLSPGCCRLTSRLITERPFYTRASHIRLIFHKCWRMGGRKGRDGKESQLFPPNPLCFSFCQFFSSSSLSPSCCR